jgi:PAS domain S-box-containing protein
VDRLAAQPYAGGIARALRQSWPVIVASLFIFPLCFRIGGDTGLWLPALGVGVALLSWTSWWLLPLLAVEGLVAELILRESHSQALLDAVLLAGQIGLSWWAYHILARGSRWLEDPRSCMIFLVLVPGLLAAGFGLIQALLWHTLEVNATPFWELFGRLWVSRMVGLLVPMPLLVILVTPWLARRRLIQITAPAGVHGNPWQRWSLGEAVEVAGLALSATVVVLVLLALQAQLEAQPAQPVLAPWSMWGVGLLIVVWSALRQGLRGGVVVASVSSLIAVVVFEWTGLAVIQAGPLQGYLLAQCSTALLVGVSASWIQASEARYRHVFSELPLVLYSARLPQPYRAPVAGRDHRADAPGPWISREAMVTLVSRACQQIFARPPEAMTGPYPAWLARIVPEDRELVIAALGQLSLQPQPVTCEYRVAKPGEEAAEYEPGNPGMRWLRDTLTPHHTEDGLLDGWEGFIEDITEHRRLSYNLRRSTTMLQALVANMPAGVFFVHGPQGYTLLANARARQLLGQREDATVPLSQLSRLYRLYRPDGSEYPADELPVAKALRHGVTCSASDLVVHRGDGRRLQLVSWAAPVELNGRGRPDAAVWVLEDLADVQPTAAMRRESETLVRALTETLANGVLIQDADGTVLDCNPAACHLLGMPRDRLLGRSGLTADTGWLTADGQALTRDESPDLRAARTGQAVRDVVLGVASPDGSSPRWLLVNALPLPAGSLLDGDAWRPRLVTSFADITDRLTDHGAAQ